MICARIDVPVRVTSVGAHARRPLDDDVDAAADLRHLADHADGADLAQIVRARIVLVVVLQQQQHQPVRAQRAVDRLDRHRAVDGERLQRQRERDGAPQRKDGKFGRKLRSGLGHRGLKAQCVRASARGSRVSPQPKAGAQGREPSCSSLSVYASRVDERQFFTEKPEQRPARFQCPRCRRTNDYIDPLDAPHEEGAGPVGRRRARPRHVRQVEGPPVRVDDDVVCKTCGKRFEIPSHRALIFLEELEGLPQDVDEEEE